MNDIRVRFEEIWPVPNGIGWNADHGRYMVLGRSSLSSGIAAVEYQARLDTFTRCQETTDVYVSLVKDMLAEIDRLAEDAYGCVPQPTQDIVDRANALIGVKNGY